MKPISITTTNTDKKTVNRDRFDVVYADPPWNINQTGKYGAIRHYNLMTLDRIKAMPVPQMMADNSACFLWVPNGLIPEGLEVLKAWGFTYRSPFFWIKTRMGLGTYLRNASETLLLGTRGSMPVAYKGQMNWSIYPLMEHSAKPTEFIDVIERLYPDKRYIELFARKRTHHTGWSIWGDQAEGGSDIALPGYPVPVYSADVTEQDLTDAGYNPDDYPMTDSGQRMQKEA